jgi:membrane associated rhomboid family serine protease
MNLFNRLIVHPKSKFSPKDQIIRFWLHTPVGVLAAIGAKVCWPIVIPLTVWFLYYETDEDSDVKDSAWIDIKGALGGLYFGIVVLWFLY